MQFSCLMLFIGLMLSIGLLLFRIHYFLKTTGFLAPYRRVLSVGLLLFIGMLPFIVLFIGLLQYGGTPGGGRQSGGGD